MRAKVSIEICILLLFAMPLAAIGEEPQNTILPVHVFHQQETPAKPTSQPSLEVHFKSILSRATKDLDELFFLPPIHLLCALTSYLRVLRQQEALADELFLLFKRFFYEYAKTNDHLETLPHERKSYMVRSLNESLRKFIQQFEGLPHDTPFLPSPKDKSFEVNPEILIRIKDSYTENFIVHREALFRRISRAFFDRMSGKYNGRKLTLKLLQQRVKDYFFSLRFLNILNYHQSQLFSKIYLSILNGLQQVTLENFRANIDHFLSELVQKSYLAKKILEVNELPVPASREQLEGKLNAFWNDAPEDFFEEMKDHFSGLFKTALEGSYDSDRASLLAVLEILKRCIKPTFNDRNYYFKSFNLFARQVEIDKPAEMLKHYKAYADELKSFKLLENEPADDIEYTLKDLVKSSPKGSVCDQNTLNQIMERHKLLIPLPQRNLGTEHSLKSLFSSGNSGGSKEVKFSSFARKLGSADRYLVDEMFKFPVKDQLTNYGTVPNTIHIEKDFLENHRFVSASEFSKHQDIPNIIPKEALRFHLEAMSRLIYPYKSVKGLSRFARIFSSYIEDLRIHDMIQPIQKRYLFSHIIRVVLNGYRNRQRYSICLALTKFKDRVPDEYHEKNTISRQQWMNAIANKKSLRTKKFGKMMANGKIRQFGPDLLRSQKFRVRAALVGSKLTKTNTREKSSFGLQRLRDKQPDLRKEHMKASAQMYLTEKGKGNLQYPGGSLTRFDSKSASGRYKQLRINAVLQKNARIKSLIIGSMLRANVGNSRIKLFLKKMKDNWVRTNVGLTRGNFQTRLANKNLSYWSMPEGHGKNGGPPGGGGGDGGSGGNGKTYELSIDGKIETGPRISNFLGRVKTFRTAEMINKNARIYNFLQQHYPFKANVVGKFEFMLKKLKDKYLKNHETLQRISSQLWFDKNVDGSLTKSSSLMTTGKVKTRRVIDGRYGLAILNCFEHHYADIPFNSWTDLHSAMKNYLDNLGGMDLDFDELAKVKRTLAYLQPFFKHNNFKYYQLYAPFQGRGKVHLLEEFESSNLQEGLTHLDSSSEGYFNTFLDAIEIAGNYLPAAQLKSVKEAVKKRFLSGDDKKAEKPLAAKLGELEVSCIKDIQKFEIEKSSEKRACQLAKHLSANINIVHLMKTKMRSIVELKRKLFFYEVLSAKNFETLRQFFVENSQLLDDVLGSALHRSLLKVVQILAKPGQETLRFSEVFALDLSVLEVKIAEIVTKVKLPCAFAIENLEIIRNLFTVYPKSLLILKGISFFELGAEMESRMAFCNRVSPKIQITLEKIRSKKFWVNQQIKALQSAIFPEVQSFDNSSKMLFQEGRYKDLSNVLKPYLNLVVIKLLSTYSKNVMFRNRSQFKKFVGKVVSTLHAKDIASRAQAELLAKVYGNRNFLSKGRFSTRKIFGHINMRLFDTRIITQAQKVSAEEGITFPVTVGRNNNFRAYARIKERLIQPLIEGIRLRKDISALFGTHQGFVGFNTKSFLAKLKRIRMKYVAKNLSYLTKKTSNVAVSTTVLKPQALRRFWATKHFKREIYKLSTLSHFKTIANFLKDLQYSGNVQQYFSKTQLKTVLKLMLHKASYTRVRPSLQRVFYPTFKPVSKMRFKQVLKAKNEQLKVIKGFVSKKLYKTLTNNLATQRVFFKILDSSVESAALNRRIGHYLKKNAILFDSSRLQTFKARFKALSLLNVQKQFLLFVKKVKGPYIAKKVHQLRHVGNGRVRFKRLVGSIIQPTSNLIAKVKQNTFSWKLRKFKSFVRDFKRMYIMKNKVGKRIGEPTKSLYQLLGLMWDLRGKKKRQSMEVGAIKTPDYPTPGKRVRIEKRPGKFVCSCECCFDFTSCPDDSGCDCNKVQMKVNHNPKFLLLADKMVNLDPTVTIRLSARSPDGGYHQVTQLTFDHEYRAEEKRKRLEEIEKERAKLELDQRRV